MRLVYENSVWKEIHEIDMRQARTIVVLKGSDQQHDYVNIVGHCAPVERFKIVPDKYEKRLQRLEKKLESVKAEIARTRKAALKVGTSATLSALCELAMRRHGPQLIY